MISSDVKCWIEYIDSYNLQKKANERSVLIWGAYSKGGIICSALEERGIRVAGYIDGHKEIIEYKEKKVYRPAEILSNKEYYIIVAIENVRVEIKEYLRKYGWVKDNDYFYFSEYIPDITISRLVGEFKDAYNNYYLYEGEGAADINIHCVGGNNTLIIGSDFAGDKNLNILMSHGSSIVLGCRFNSSGISSINASIGGKISIGKDFNLKNASNINARYDAAVEIGNNVTTGDRFFLSSGRNSKVSIGHDCMFSHDVSIHGTNGHSIIDLTRQENRSTNNECPIEIGNHVWLGKGASVLYGSQIGDGCVVGTASMVRGIYPTNCIIAGNIARVIRENCTWDRRREIDFYDL